MTINFTFNDLDEMEAAILRMAENMKIFKTGVPEPQEEPEEVPAEKTTEKAEKIPAKAETPAEPKKEEQPEHVKEEAPKVDRVALRKILSVLNKTTGENTARKLINDMGFSALTNVPDDRLAELKAKAEEVINAQ
jgi:hypothetical protein